MCNYIVRSAVVENSDGNVIGGTIEPMGEVSVEEGTKKVFNIKVSNPGAYMVEKVIVDGVIDKTKEAIETNSVELFGDADHTISVSFKERQSVEVITPELAKMYLSNMVSNRKPNQNRIHAYAKIMASGKWRANDESIKFNTDGQLCDGQHRLLAAIVANTSVPMSVIRGCNKLDMKTYDTGKPKSARDALYANGGNGDCATGIVSYLGISTGYSVDNTNPVSIRVSNETICDVYNSDSEYWNDLCKFAKKLRNPDQHGSMMMPDKNRMIGVIAFLERTRKYESDFVRWFFESLADFRDSSNKAISVLRENIRKEFERGVKKTNVERWADILYVLNKVYSGVNRIAASSLPVEEPTEVKSIRKPSVCKWQRQ
jgi:hypothetical protein